MVTEIFICPIDNTSYLSRQELHNHLKKIKVKQEYFYRKYHGDRRDKLTGEPIEFRSVDFYLNSFFNTRANMIEYFKKRPDYSEIRELYEARAKQKNWKFFPSTIEARTSILPTELFLNSINHYSETFAADLGLLLRYDYKKPPVFDDFTPLSVLVDTREQQPLKLPCETVIGKLDVGDYVSRSHFDSVAIDRKSLSDLCGTMSQGFERFQREIIRAKELGMYLIVLVEQKLEDLLNLAFLPAAKNIKASSDFICSRIRELYQTYDNIQFVFADGRGRAAKLVTKILTCAGAKSVDWQYEIDSKRLSL